MESFTEYGYWGMFFASFLAATVIPIGSEIVFTLLIASGLNGLACTIIASVGNWAGGMTSYYLGYLGRWEWLSKWFGVQQTQLEKLHLKIEKYGITAALFCWLPFVGDLIAVLMGLIKINPLKFSILMFIGKFLRYVFLWYSVVYLIS